MITQEEAMTQSIETLAREIAADTWEQSVRDWRKRDGRVADESWIKTTRSIFMNGSYDDGRDYAAAIAGIKLGREQAAVTVENSGAAVTASTIPHARRLLAQAIRALP